MDDSQDRPLTGDEAYMRIKELAVEAAILFNNAEIRSNYLDSVDRHVRDVGFRLRDALTYRFDAIVYHVDLLHQIHSDVETRLVDPVVMRNAHDVLHATVSQQRFIFDDIVFNCVGIFDYFGRFAGTLLQADPEMKLRWDRLYKWAKHANAGGANNRIAHSKLAPIVIRHDQRWIKHLIEFRSHVIHYESEKLDGSVSFRFANNQDGHADVSHSIQPFVPSAFLSAMKIRTSGSRISVIEAAHLLVTKVFFTLEELLIALGEELETRVPDIPPGTVLNAPTFMHRKPNKDN